MEIEPATEAKVEENGEEILGDITQDSIMEEKADSDKESAHPEKEAEVANTEQQGSSIEVEVNESKPLDEQSVKSEEDENNLEVSSLSVAADQEDIEHHLSLHTIGASNMEGLIMKGDNQLKITHHNHFEGGLKIRKSHEKLDDIHDGVKLNLPIIAANIGACDMSEVGYNDLDRMESRYVELMDKIRAECPKSQIVISGIIPRNGDRYQKVNSDIHLFNERLRNLCIPEKGLVFCDNYHWVTDEFNQVKSELYRDNSNIHLSVIGQEMLSNSIFRVVKYLYFKSFVGELPDSLSFTPEEEASMYRLN